MIRIFLHRLSVQEYLSNVDLGQVLHITDIWVVLYFERLSFRQFVEFSEDNLCFYALIVSGRFPFFLKLLCLKIFKI